MSSFDFAAAKQSMRQVLHDTLAVAAFYSDKVVTIPVAITARWHSANSKFMVPIQSRYAGYPEQIENSHKLVLNNPDLLAAGIDPTSVARGAQIVIPEYNNATFLLELREPEDGPPNQTWTVVRK